MLTDTTDLRFEYVLRLADDALVLGHRLSEWSSRAPTLEEDIALSNIGLDLVGQARSLYAYAGRLESNGRDEDVLAFGRDANHYLNLQLVERPNGDFAATMARQLFYSTFAELFWSAMKQSKDAELSGIAAKAEKECAYHVRHSAEWVIRLGDGTDESRARMQREIDEAWMFTGELLAMDEVDRAMIDAGIGVDRGALKPSWDTAIDAVLAEATLDRPRDGWMISGGRRGIHTEHLGPMLAVMQSLPRTYPGAKW
jgi:ring-1,2-phenylacetyl-CoA epoxidase subunit PaaC